MLEVGFYHSDPHPGNLLRKEDGRLAYIDVSTSLDPRPSGHPVVKLLSMPAKDVIVAPLVSVVVKPCEQAIIHLQASTALSPHPATFACQKDCTISFVLSKVLTLARHL